MSDVIALIVDADETNSHFMAQLLRKNGYRVYTCPTGKDGLTRAHDYLPGVIICDTGLPDISAPEFIQRIQGDRRFALTPVIAISSKYELSDMERCLAAGYHEYYAKSGTAAVALVNSIPRLIAESVTKSKQYEKGYLCVFLSAKGGVGTTSLCANIGQNLAQSMPQSKTAVADLVLPMGSIASIVGYDKDFNIEYVAQRPTEGITPDFLLDHLPIAEKWGFYLLPGSPDPEVASRLHADRIPKIIKSMREAFHYVVIDAGRMLTKTIIPIIKEADTVALVIGTDMISVELSKRLWLFLEAQGVQRERLYPILNRAVGLQGLTKPEVEKVLGMEIRVTIPYMMDNFALANNMHIPMITKYPNDTASMTLKQTAVEISRKSIRVRTGELKSSRLFG